MSAELEYIWSRVQAELAAAVDEPTYRIWLQPLRARELSHGTLYIEASPQACGWVGDRFGRVLHACAASAIGSEVVIELVPASHRSRSRAGGPSDAAGPAGAREGHGRSPGDGKLAEGGQGDRFDGPAPSPLGNPKLTFDQFVIGDGNRLAHAAALAVAEMPAHAYNPLFICGPPGVGKTHLLSSIASLLLSHNPGLSVRYTTGEAFTNDFLYALSRQRANAFKAHFRDIDVLLVDDVQFLERKTRTEEEFFHTFNALYDAGHQIVLTSDRPPRDLQALEDRLRERFESGLVADIDAPDLPTRLTILRKRAHQDRVEVPADALELIATRVTEHVRALEGALIRVVAFASLTGRPLTPDLTVEVLDGLYPNSSPRARRGRPSVSDITAAACAHFGLTVEEIMSPSRTARIAWPRQLAMYLSRELTDDSLPAIGRQFGGRDHTTVLHACRKAASRIAADSISREAVDKLLAELQPTPATHHETVPDRTA